MFCSGMFFLQPGPLQRAAAVDEMPPADGGLRGNKKRLVGGENGVVEIAGAGGKKRFEGAKNNEFYSRLGVKRVEARREEGCLMSTPGSSSGTCDPVPIVLDWLVTGGASSGCEGVPLAEANAEGQLVETEFGDEAMIGTAECSNGR
jgi:hypothetical protein